jgi:hypothetical protein
MQEWGYLLLPDLITYSLNTTFLIIMDLQLNEELQVGLRKTVKDLSQNSFRDSRLGPPEYEVL